MKKNMKKDIY